MSGTYAVVMGDRGRLVVPSELRERAGLKAGSPLVLIGTDEGLVILTREQAKSRLRAQLSGGSLVEELMQERRGAADAEEEP